MDRRIARFWKWLKHRLELGTIERREKERRQAIDSASAADRRGKIQRHR
jgi:hypothetical protein